MKPPDEFGRYYEPLIEASYDCVDRLTINAYFPLGQTGGGFRSWWRQWQGGELRHPETWPHVQHYYFQIQDPQWGHIVVRLCGYPPWGAQVILNGHERVERAAGRAGVSLSKAGNCFVEGTDYGAVNGLAELLTEAQMPQELQALCERWLRSIRAIFCFGKRRSWRRCFRNCLTGPENRWT